jgi:hypothetical protein
MQDEIINSKNKIKIKNPKFLGKTKMFLLSYFHLEF